MSKIKQSYKGRATRIIVKSNYSKQRIKIRAKTKIRVKKV